ncbi:hypothetical protein HQQ94_15000 [Shewanella sp. VB17]|uniref:hypothetical protein n=1 Tax=Shewanella sp. VB17 TaxID=2739432 RepID=UPI0015659B5F|nr:hypothetical protein [Shewanella sp. VB17]NRD74521.1 hypothetical protein [Shewanella sp. VB17]
MKKDNKLIFIFILILLFTSDLQALTFEYNKKEEVKINIGRSEDSNLARIYECIYYRILKSDEFNVIFNYRPTKRSISEVSYGIADIDAGRISRIDKSKYSDTTIRVKESIYKDRFSLFSKSKINIPVDGWDAIDYLIKELNITPIFIRGNITVKVNTSEETYAKIFPSNDFTHAINNLNKGDSRNRTVLISSASQVDYWLKKLNIENIIEIKNLGEHTLYPIVSNNKKHLERYINNGLVKMKSQGEYDKILSLVNKGLPCK